MKKILGSIVALFIAFNCHVPAFANGADGHKDAALHFTHPTIVDSPSPDTKVRLDYFYRSVEEGDEKEKEHEFAFGFEYAFHPSFVIEKEIPYTIIDPEGESSESDIGSIALGLKFANYAFAEHNLLLGYGIEFALPTGNDEKGIGSDHIWEVEPFFSLGYKTGKVQLISFLIFGIPFNQEEGEEVETELSYQVSQVCIMCIPASGPFSNLTEQPC